MSVLSANDMVDARGGGDTDEIDARGQPRLPRMSESAFSSLLYDMGHQNRGVAVIINNTNIPLKAGIEGHFGDGERSLTEPSKDANLMFELLETLGFKDIRFYKDQTTGDMRSILNKVAAMNHTNNDCFVCVILTHGDDGFVYGTDKEIPVDKLTKPFKGDLCPTLAGKPKLFLIQASKSFMPEEDTESHEAGDEMTEEETARRIPTEADFLMAYSMIPAWRNISHSSWFIQAIHDVFKENWQTMDLLTMITRVNNKVARAFESDFNNEFKNQNRQISYITCMLTKDLFFTLK